MQSRPSPDTSPSHRTHTWCLRSVGFAALLLGCRAAWLYHRAGLTLSHYDAKAHLVVARRVVDNLTPGWAQIGAVWLPLPHLLNLVPVQIDVLYRTGASGVAISVLAFALAAFGVARMVVRATGSRAAAVAGAAVLALNPNLLYLQSTPMTEGLLVGLMVIAVSFTIDWLDETADICRDGGARARQFRRRAGFAIAAACLTRYEAWFVTAALLALSFAAIRLRNRASREAVVQVSKLAVYPLAAVLAFLIHSRLTVGQWLVSGGFFVPDNIDTGNPFRAVASVWWGTHVVSGYAVEFAAVAGALACVAVALRDRRRSWLLAALALFAAGALPAYAFFDGHPFRIRYMTPLVPALASCAGLGIGLLRGRGRSLAAVAMVGLVLLETPPFDLNAPMVLEAQWDSGNSAARRQVTRYLVGHYDGREIMASMASLAHYMQELSRAGFPLRDFLHEGNGDLWQNALRDPRRQVGWILVEEWAEGGDRLATLARRDPRFLQGFERVAEGGGVALYRAAEAGRAGRGGTGASGTISGTPAARSQPVESAVDSSRGAGASKVNVPQERIAPADLARPATRNR